MIKVIFEDREFTKLLPLVYFRPVWALRCGALTIAEKATALFGESIKKSCRSELVDLFGEVDAVDADDSRPALWINGRWLLNKESVTVLAELKAGHCLVSGKNVAAICAAPSELAPFLDRGILDTQEAVADMRRREIKASFINYLWDAVNANGAEIEHDWRLMAPPTCGPEGRFPGAHLVNPLQISIADSAQINPGVVLDATNGPVWISDDAVVMANAVLEGPVYVGKGSRIKIGAKIYENTSIGPVCKIGGEVEGSIIWGYSNKQHDGFLGHAYLGAWVNLGADTNNSDLKNNYGEVTVLVNGEPTKSGSRFVGLLMGDHSKTAINTMFNTGTVVGVSCNVFGAGMPPKFIPSFSWGGAEGISRYNFEKAVALAEIVMARRKIDFDQRQVRLFGKVKELADSIEKIV